MDNKIKTITLDYKSYCTELQESKDLGERVAMINVIHFLDSKHSAEDYFKLYSNPFDYYKEKLVSLKNELQARTEPATPKEPITEKNLNDC